MFCVQRKFVKGLDKMNKLILALALVLTPFFSDAQSIFNDENTVPAQMKSHFCADATYGAALGHGCGQSEIDAMNAACSSLTSNMPLDNTGAGVWPKRTYSQPTCKRVGDSFELWDEVTTEYAPNYSQSCDCMVPGAKYGPEPRKRGVPNFNVSGSGEELTCPPDSNPLNTFYVDSNNDGESESCANPDEIPNFDTCNDGDNTMLQNRVSVSTGCFSKPDDSQCKYNAVDVGGGVEAYALDPEGNCYSDPEPDIVGENNQLPNDNECTDWGSTGDMVCGESPQDVCSADGLSCQDGCGTVNGETFCFSGDQDGDDLPNYLDPDKDGDGIPNKDDLDSDGDGKDDPIDNSGKGDGDNGGGGGVSVDLKPLVSKLDEIKKSISETDVELQTKPTEELVGFWETEYEDGLQGVMDEKFIDIKATSFFTFIETLAPTVGGGSSAKFDMCFNLGGMGDFGCHNFNVDPRVFPAIKVFILILAGFLCRRILFGG